MIFLVKIGVLAENLAILQCKICLKPQKLFYQKSEGNKVSCNVLIHKKNAFPTLKIDFLKFNASDDVP